MFTVSEAIKARAAVEAWRVLLDESEDTTRSDETRRSAREAAHECAIDMADWLDVLTERVLEGE